VREKAVSDRDADLWTPLFVICSITAPARVEELKACAITLSGSKADEDTEGSYSLKLLADIREVWQGNDKNIGTKALLDKLRALDESPWATEYELTDRKLARLLRPFGVVPRSVREGEKTPKGYTRESLDVAFTRYLDVSERNSDTDQ
jgi:hypothetical protein